MEASKKRDLHVLVVGRTGSGKSTLVNAMLGQVLAPQSHGASPTKHKTIEPHRLFMGTMAVHVYDTPGFLDRRQTTKDLLQEITREQPQCGFDIIIVCHRIIDRFDESTAELIDTLSNHELRMGYGAKYIVALTFANLFLEYTEVSGLKYKEAKKELLVRKVKDFKTHFNEMSTEKALNETPPFFEDVPFIVAGTSAQRALPNTSDWLHDLWRACYQQSSNEAKPLINNLTFQLGFNHSLATSTATGLGAATTLIVGTSPLIPEIGSTISSIIFPPNRSLILPPTVKDVVTRKSSHKGAKPVPPLPSVKAEELSTEIFKELGLQQ